MSLTLYAAPQSSATPVVMAIKELDVPCEIVLLDLKKKEQKEPGFLALNPNGKVPTLVVDGTPMFEALAILCWLGGRFGVERGLWPAENTGARVEALSWSTWAYVTYGAAVVRLSFASSEFFREELHNAAQARSAREELSSLLGMLDSRLATRPYLLGESYSLVDLIVASTVTYGTFFGVPVDQHPNVVAWLERFHSRPAYRAIWASAA